MQILHKMNEYNVFFLTADSLYSLFLIDSAQLLNALKKILYIQRKKNVPNGTISAPMILDSRILILDTNKGDSSSSSITV
ncbi:hypothetical protein DERF_010468 [Dermatophagoides farinae]|uniref:Uncharacterized protein n=1 Tax=Dermatophagoides farinae TaxID=6954 RepID=A0A922HZD3_DERFA|nr:hypothetical protein DERF_010468 [Dermatophagoides farinae]